MRSTPAWFRRTLTYSSWPQAANAHGPFGKDKLTGAERRFLGGIPLFINVQSANAIRQAHELGGRALSYVSFMDTYAHTAGFERGTARAPWDPKKPQMLLIGKDGRFVNTPMDGTWRMWRYLVCNNTREYVEAALDLARGQMEAGADGLFIDNSGARRPCYGHGVPVGYSEGYRQVMAAITAWEDESALEKYPPEELYRRGFRPTVPSPNPRIRELPVHRHIYPGKSHAYAYGRLLEKVRRLVRSYGPDKIVVTNGAARPEAVDGVMLESYLYSWISQGPRTTWDRLKKQAEEWAPFIRKGGRVLALTYLGRSNRSVDEDALHACAAAMLSGFLWSDAGTFKTKLGDALRRLDPGARLTGIESESGIDYSFFERGLVAVNGGSRKRAAALPLPRGFGHSRLRDLIDGGCVTARDGAFRVVAPPHSGRALLAT